LLCSDLSAAGGAERLIFEEAAALRARGHNVRIITFSFSLSSTFSGRYHDNVDCLRVRGRTALGQLFSALVRLFRLLRSEGPDLVIAMSAYDCARVFGPAMLTRTRYIAHINGTQFWFTDEYDLTKYSWQYRHAWRAVLARPAGHEEFLPSSAPALGIHRRPRIEGTVLLQRLAVRRARERIAFSRRMAWEVELLYRRSCRT
jgi:hypothetical protein